MSTIAVTGPSGFVGSHLVPALIGAGHRVRAVVRSDRAHGDTLARLTPAQQGSTEFARAEITDEAGLERAFEGADGVLHLVGIPRDWNGGKDLAQINTGGTKNVIEAMHRAGVRRFVHLGALGVVDDARLHYAQSKARAEEAVAQSELDWTILKPSLMWGERDGFFNVIATLVRISPGLVPFPAGQKARFQPLWVEDLGRVVAQAFERPDTIHRVHELGGPDYLTYRDMVAEVVAGMGRRRVLVPMPLPLIKLMARTSETLHLPFPVASDQLRQLAYDNVTLRDAVPREWGFEPRSLKGNLGYLKRSLKDQDPAA